jgi:hypothetical protein
MSCKGHGIDLSAALRKPGMAERYLGYKSARALRDANSTANCLSNAVCRLKRSTSQCMEEGFRKIANYKI